LIKLRRYKMMIINGTMNDQKNDRVTLEASLSQRTKVLDQGLHDAQIL